MATDPTIIRVEAVVDALGVGGAELLLAEFARESAEVGIDFGVTGLYGAPEEIGGPDLTAGNRLREVGIDPQLVGIRRMLDPAGLRRVRGMIARARPDIVHTHLEASDFLGGLAARSLGLPLVSTIHGHEWSRRRQRLRSRLATGVRRRCAESVICVSEGARRGLIERGWDAPERTVMIPNGIADPLVAPGAGAEVRRELGLDDAPLVFVMVARLRPEKGFGVASEATSIIQEQVPGARLLIVGDGPERASLESFDRELSGVRVLAGHRDDIAAVLDASDVMLQPSYHDAYPTSLMQAAAAGIPAIGTAVGGIPEIIADGETGLLIPSPPRAEALADAMLALALDPLRRTAFGAAARRRYETTFTARVWAQRLRDFYDEVLAREP